MFKIRHVSPRDGATEHAAHAVREQHAPGRLPLGRLERVVELPRDGDVLAAVEQRLHDHHETLGTYEYRHVPHRVPVPVEHLAVPPAGWHCRELTDAVREGLYVRRRLRRQRAVRRALEHVKVQEKPAAVVVAVVMHRADAARPLGGRVEGHEQIPQARQQRLHGYGARLAHRESVDGPLGARVPDRVPDARYLSVPRAWLNLGSDPGEAVEQAQVGPLVLAREEPRDAVELRGAKVAGQRLVARAKGHQHEVVRKLG